MRKIWLKFYNNTGSKGLLIGLAVFVPIWTWRWSVYDERFNPTIIIIGVAIVAAMMIGEWLSVLVKKWRARK